MVFLLKEIRSRPSKIKILTETKITRIGMIKVEATITPSVKLYI